MGWFDEQIKTRKQLDDEVTSDAFARMIGAVEGGRIYAILNDSRYRTKTAIDEILRFYHVRSPEIPDNITDIDEQLEFVLHPHGIMRRSVELEKGWYRNAIGAMLTARRTDGAVVAMIPSGLSGYSYTDPDTGKRVKVNGKNAEEFEDAALAFYKPFPLKKLGIRDLLVYMLGLISSADVVLYVASILVVTMIGMLLPKLNNILFTNVIDSKSVNLLMVVTVFMISITVSRLIFGAVKALFESRINTKLNIFVEAASMMRVLSLPASFFKKYSSGNLSSRIGNIQTLCEMLVSAVFSTGFTSVFSLSYVSLLFRYAPALVVPALLIILCTTAFSIAVTLARMRVVRTRMELSAKESGMSYAMISGVQKIKLSGSEKRAFARWGNLYAEKAKLLYNPPFFLKVSSVISTAVTLTGTIVLYYEAAETGVTPADYISFTSAFGVISGAFSGIIEIAQNIASVRPTLEMAGPILEAEPEISDGKEVLNRLSGGIEINNVSFRYNENGPDIIDDLSLKIRPGQYLAIVGKTGCGKSTLVRLLLGFEKPGKGAIYYDGKDMNGIDLKSLRKKIGVVMQEGKLFQGSIFSNITISAPTLTLDDAWEAAEMAGIAEDIRQMPMGMHTLVSEGAGGISGGQRQRLMIARAVAPKPKILIFDEATSALDNITQKKVSGALDSLKCTRIVIAHRLSTIRNCDRIICLDQGNIIEDGTYDELIAKKGFFADLVARQRVETGEPQK